MHSLPLFVRLQGRPVLLVGDGEAAAAKRRLLDRAGADVRTSEADAAALAIVALDGADADAAAARLKARGMLVNVVDRPDLCDFTLPAIVDRDPVLVAFGTGGASAGLAKALRQRLETLLPAQLGAFATALRDARGVLREKWPDPLQRRQKIDAIIARSGVFDGQQSLSLAVDLADDVPVPARLSTLQLISADPDDLTLRAARLLAGADGLWHAGTVPNAILDRARADAQRHIAPAPPSPPPPGAHVWLEFGQGVPLP